MIEPSTEKFSFCETVHASSISPWHIRRLTAKGKKLGGGADTKSLCGREVSWDLKVDIDSRLLKEAACPKCREEFHALLNTAHNYD